MQCEQCTTEIESVEDAHSMLVVLQKVCSSGFSFYQCEQGGMVDGHTFQHWNCSKDEMIQSVKECISTHHMEQLLQAVSVSQVRLHLHVLSSGLICKVCQEPLKDAAYRFCLTVATPVNYIPDNTDDSLYGWSCSFEHAHQDAFTTLEGL